MGVGIGVGVGIGAWLAQAQAAPATPATPPSPPRPSAPLPQTAATSAPPIIEGKPVRAEAAETPPTARPLPAGAAAATTPPATHAATAGPLPHPPAATNPGPAAPHDPAKNHAAPHPEPAADARTTKPPAPAERTPQAPVPPVPQIARDAWKDCAYNGATIGCRDEHVAGGLRIVWKDGLRMTYRERPARRPGEPVYLEDRYGGLWRRELLVQGNTVLTNLRTGNRILVPLRLVCRPPLKGEVGYCHP